MMTIESLSEIADAELLEFVLKIAHEIHDKLGSSDPYFPTSGNKIVVAREDGEIAAFAAWQEWQGCAFVGLVWVRPVSRQCGVYRAMVDAIRAEARPMGLKHVCAAVHGGNTDSLLAHEHIYGKPDTVYFKAACDEVRA